MPGVMLKIFSSASLSFNKFRTEKYFSCVRLTNSGILWKQNSYSQSTPVCLISADISIIHVLFSTFCLKLINTKTIRTLGGPNMGVPRYSDYANPGTHLKLLVILAHDKINTHCWLNYKKK